ncbi:ribokinase [Humitalea rosea]|uniref:Ribokinase n=1 Tax=Humitalea rosea TaxID=990373 RepID=A0A2W7IKR8_9PROT|nr:PfkB family carbohydrate kinase [Humitalea rosea]PZW39967.1 ribokinase [Humitalea rosea]
MSVLVFGSAAADIVFRLPSLPHPGETILGDAAPLQAGGKGANQALAAARDGARVAFAGAIGADAAGEVVRGPLLAAGVDCSRLAVVDRPTGIAAVCVDPEGANLIAVATGANARASAAQVEEAALHPGLVLLLQMEVPAAETAALIFRARAQGARIILNLAPAAALDPAALRALDLLVVNEHEAAWLAAQLGAGAGAEALHAALGIGVAVTLGERGAMAATAAGVVTLPGLPVRAVDTVGAGDCWCGVLAAALDRDLPLEAAMRRANAAAALSCTRPGAGAAMPDAAEIDALLRKG